MNLTPYFADFHIHVGRALGRPVKMAAAPSLTLTAILEQAREQKGLHMITVIDGVCTGVHAELKQLFAQSLLKPVAGGGYEYVNGLRILIGAEIEVAGPFGGSAHFGVWFGNLDAAKEFQDWLRTVQKNVSLSSQRVSVDAFTLQSVVKQHGGVFIIHHAFTPHRGLYGSCVHRLSDMVDPLQVDALELGLSADTDMADCISELSEVTFLSNSDAHSLPKIAREYNSLLLASPNFEEVKKALLRQSGRRVSMNFGLLPALGKYHRTHCQVCKRESDNALEPCPCGSKKYVSGVYERLLEVRDLPITKSPVHRPPYIHQVPLEFIPGLGPKLRTRLVQTFGTEMAILHHTTVEELEQVVGTELAARIDDARTGRVRVAAGGGGVYGKVLSNRVPL